MFALHHDGNTKQAVMTNVDGSLPCFTAVSSTRMLIPAKNRWLSVVEKASCLLWPVVPEFAAAAGVPIVKEATLVAAQGHTMTVAARA